MPRLQPPRAGSESSHARWGWLAVVAAMAAAAVATTALPPSAAPPSAAPPAAAPPAADAPAVDAPAVEPDKVGVFMRAKLGHGQKVLEGLTVEDYDLIEKGAHDLALASQDSSWQVLQTEDYARQSDEFRRSCNALRAAAKARNLDGAALAWMEVTMKCIQCHKYVRDTRREP